MDEFETDNIPDDFFSSHFESEIYCSCKSDDSSHLIECKSKECKIKFYHIQCVGLQIVSNGPLDWICCECLGKGSQQLSTSDSKQKQSSKNGPSAAASVEKGFTLEIAIDNAKDIVASVLSKAKPFCRLNSSFTDVLSTAISNIEGKDLPTNACKQLIQLLWPSVGEADSSKQLISARLEKKASAFHSIRGSDEIRVAFKDLMESLRVSHYPLNIQTFLSQFLLEQLFQELLKKKQNRLLKEDTKCTSNNLSKSEEQALRFTAGYICRKLTRHFVRYQSNSVSKLCWELLQKFKVSENQSDTENVLAYTKEWMEIVNRGGLFSVSNDVYIFFREMEKIVKAYLNKATNSQVVTKRNPTSASYGQ